MGQKRIHLVVHGRVQGVYFRATAQREARQHGLSGWVKNRGDGAVEIVAEGEEDDVKDFLNLGARRPFDGKSRRGRRPLAKLHG